MSVDFADYRARIQAKYEMEESTAKNEKNRLGDIDKDESEIVPLEKDTEEEKDKRLYAEYLRKGLINIKNLVLKNPLHRTPKETEFLILYLKH